MARVHRERANEIKRPFRTEYYTTRYNGLYSQVGNSLTLDGAKHSAIIRLLDGQYVRAAIFDRYTGRLIEVLRGTGWGISIDTWSAKHQKALDKKRK